MKQLLKRLMYKLGYSVQRLDSHIEIDSPWGPNILKYALDDLNSLSTGPLKIVQIGAHDGSDQDPLQQFLLSSDAEGILIEPMDQPFELLSRRYKDVERIKTVQKAISDVPSMIEMYYIVDGNGNPDLTLFSSFDKETATRSLSKRQKNDPKLRDHKIVSKHIQADTLKSVLSQEEFGPVDAIIVDVEGLDHKIVRSFLNAGVEPKIIRFEYCNLSRRDFYDLCDLLREKDYEIVRSGIDIYCQKTNLLR